MRTLLRRTRETPVGSPPLSLSTYALTVGRRKIRPAWRLDRCPNGRGQHPPCDLRCCRAAGAGAPWGHEVLARGSAETEDEARAQAADAKRKAKHQQ